MKILPLVCTIVLIFAYFGMQVRQVYKHKLKDEELQTLVDNLSQADPLLPRFFLSLVFGSVPDLSDAKGFSQFWTCALHPVACRNALLQKETLVLELNDMKSARERFTPIITASLMATVGLGVTDGGAALFSPSAGYEKTLPCGVQLLDRSVKGIPDERKYGPFLLPDLCGLSRNNIKNLKKKLRTHHCYLQWAGDEQLSECSSIGSSPLFYSVTPKPSKKPDSETGLHSNWGIFGLHCRQVGVTDIY
ncbi:uncharacterized protein LOC119579393 [Penaeus monodon]|uniref:uncharacterized protein LOC119579393 n=1 Tax=Penaeus monodon TaxID=6687 RepID=UPI0018A72EA2|nr:uncharacterized protein LOC119579393 [Penaeus monodon]